MNMNNIFLKRNWPGYVLKIIRKTKHNINSLLYVNYRGKFFLLSQNVSCLIGYEMLRYVDRQFIDMNCFDNGMDMHCLRATVQLFHPSVESWIWPCIIYTTEKKILRPFSCWKFHILYFLWNRWHLYIFMYVRLLVFLLQSLVHTHIFLIHFSKLAIIKIFTY